MDDLSQAYYELKMLSATHSDRMAEELNQKTTDRPTSFFNIAHNIFHRNVEILSHYHQYWSSIDQTNILDDYTITERQQKVRNVIQWSFVNLLSALEYTAKQALPDMAPTNAKGARRVYLRDLLNNSHDAGLITREQINCWKGLMELRNSLIHNNAIADENATYSYPGVTLTFTKEERVEMIPIQVPLIKRWIINNAREWFTRHHQMKFSSH